jgi:hypothetical protein
VRLDGVTDVCPQPDPDTWTCRVVRRDGRLPDVAAIERAIQGAGDQFSLRGVEVEAVGVMRQDAQGLELRLDVTGERLRVVPLAHRVEWSFRAQRAPESTAEEREAWARLKAAAAAAAARAPLRVRLTGTLCGGALEVRRFTAVIESPRK